MPSGHGETQLFWYRLVPEDTKQDVQFESVTEQVEQLDVHGWQIVPLTVLTGRPALQFWTH